MNRGVAKSFSPNGKWKVFQIAGNVEKVEQQVSIIVEPSPSNMHTLHFTFQIWSLAILVQLWDRFGKIMQNQDFTKILPKSK